MTASPFDLPTPGDLRRRGSLKWTAFPGAIGAFVAEADFGLAPVVAEALEEAVAAGRTGYLPHAEGDALREATAAWAADRLAWEVRPEQVQPVADVLAGLELVLRRFSDPSRPVVVPTPAYMPFLDIPAAVGREVIRVPSPVVDGRSELDLAGIDRAFSAGADVLVLCDPWNPVGRVLEREELLALAEVVDRHGARVFADAIHAPITYSGHPHVPYASISGTAAAHTITAISASKAFDLPGLKCAQLILTNPADADRYGTVAGFAAHGASTFGVIATTAAYRRGGPWLDGVVDHLDGSRAVFGDRLAGALPTVGFTPPEGTYLGWLDVRSLGLGDRPADAVLERTGVALTDGAACGAPGFLRIVLATPRPVLEEIVDRLGAAFG